MAWRRPAQPSSLTQKILLQPVRASVTSDGTRRICPRVAPKPGMIPSPTRAILRAPTPAGLVAVASDRAEQAGRVIAPGKAVVRRGWRVAVSDDRDVAKAQAGAGPSSRSKRSSVSTTVVRRMEPTEPAGRRCCLTPEAVTTTRLLLPGGSGTLGVSITECPPRGVLPSAGPTPTDPGERPMKRYAPNTSVYGRRPTALGEPEDIYRPARTSTC